LPRLPIAKGRRHAGHQPHRPQVRVLPELTADRDQQTPKRDVVRHSGKAHRAEENRIVVPDSLESVLRHHPPVLGVVLAAPGKFVPAKVDAVLSAGGFQHPHAFGDHFLADSVAREKRDLVLAHRCIPHLCTVLLSMFRKIRFSTAKPIKITVKSPANTFAVSSRFLFSKMYQPNPPEPWLTPNTNSAAIKVRQAKAQPILSPVRMLGKAAGIRINATYRKPERP